MSNAPWYLRAGDNEGPSLKHHKAPGKYNADPKKLEERYNRGKKAVRSFSIIFGREERKLISDKVGE